ncbi:MAG: hypothetical protein MZV70_71750 [Desulfobacterales bacterium]|nr:hypothetical protein [Desulfobacterales bacterium]
MLGVKMKIGHEDHQGPTSSGSGRSARPWATMSGSPWTPTRNGTSRRPMRVGRELEQLGVAWFEEPMLCEDIPGHAQARGRVGHPHRHGRDAGVALTNSPPTCGPGAVDILQPDIVRVGGITEMVKVVDPGGCRQPAGGAAPHDGEHDP